MKLLIFLTIVCVSVSNWAQEATSKGGTPERTVEQIVGEVIENNPEAKFYRAEIAIAKGGRRGVGALNNPEVAVEAGSKRQSEPGGIAGEGLAWSVSVNQTFEFPGRLALRKSIANRQIELAELGFMQFRAALSARARELAIAVLTAQERADAATSVAERARTLAAVMIQRDPAGVTPLLETRILEASAITAMHKSGEAYKDWQAALAELNQLRGAPIEERVRILSPKFQYPPAPSLQTLLATARTNNFDLRIRRIELEQQGLKVDLAKNERFPAITVEPFYSEEKALDFERQAGIGVSLPVPIWNRNKGNIEIANARRIQAEASLQVEERKVDREVATALAALQTSLSQMEHWPTNALQHFKEAAEVADKNYQLGAIPVATYVELQRQYLEAVEAIVSTQAEADASRNRIELLAGWIHPSEPKPEAEQGR
jgi:cobalt-zinc-cadmium efflux system outer membrane protein